MSGSVGSATGGAWDLLGQVSAQTAQVQQRIDQLTQQVSTGLVAQDFAGLSASAGSTALDLTPQVAHLANWQGNINAAATAMNVTQGALSQISGIASSFSAQLNNINSLTPTETDNIAANARAALQQVAGLIDSQAGGNYVFAGQDSANPPIPSPDSILASGMVTQIQTAVAGLTSGNAATIAANTLTIAQSNAAGTSPFSAAMSQPAANVAALQPRIAIGQGQSITVGIMASANSFVTSTGSSTTGSYMRDVLRALATIGSLTSTQVSGTADVAGLVQDTRISLGGAITALNQDAGVLGDRQASLTTLQGALTDTQTALTTQLSGATDANVAQTMTQLSLAQTKLQASYQVIANLAQMSLAKFLPA